MLLHRNVIVGLALAGICMVPSAVAQDTRGGEVEVSVPTLGGPPPMVPEATSAASRPLPADLQTQPPGLPVTNRLGTSEPNKSAPSGPLGVEPEGSLTVSPSESAGDEAGVIAYPELSPDAVLLSAIRRQAKVAQARGELLKAKADNRAVRALLSGGEAGQGAPTLVGLYGAGDNVRAEFLVGDAVLTARPGDWVNDDWRLDEILRNGVRLSGADGASKMVLLGSAATAASPLRGSAQPVARQQGFGPTADRGMTHEFDPIHSPPRQ